MEQIPIRALNQDTAGVLARVQAGEAIEITRHGRAVARIVPVGHDAMSDLVAAGGALVICLDTAALVKLVRIEADSEALVAWLYSNPATPLVASALIEVELLRALQRAEPATLGSVAAGRTITAFVTYDHRLSAAVAVLGLPFAAPAAERG